MKLKPDYADAYYNLGIALLRQGKLDEATRSWLQTLRIKPDYADAHFNLGVVLARQQKHDQAISHWLEVIRLDARNTAALVNLSAGYAKTGEFSKAILYAEKALTLARAAGNDQLAQEINRRIEFYRQKRPLGTNAR
jgi:tetratricopeptide (TPR) repeat protein